MEPKCVLVLGNKDKAGWIQGLLNHGTKPIVSRNIQHTLTKLRHGRFAAVLLDYAQIDVDVLELVLNIRDINDHIPVIIKGAENLDNYEVLVSLGGIYIINKDTNDEFCRTLRMLLSMNKSKQC